VKEANVVYHEHELALEYSDVIHPYAWAHARPDPFYDPSVDAYSVGKSDVLASFLETQTSLKSTSPQAATLLEVSHEAVITSKTHTAKAKAPVLDFQINPKGFLKIMGIKVEPVKDLPKIENDFRKIPNEEEATGSFPGALHYRRGQYGTRRRRLPYYSTSEGFGSVNPYRELNSFFKSPNDVLAPRVKWHAAKDPSIFDLGRFAHHEAKLPYAGFSSFHNARFRSARDAGTWHSSFIDHPHYFHPLGFKGTGAGRLSDGTPVGHSIEHWGGGIPGPRAHGDFATNAYTQPRFSGSSWLHPRFGSPSPYIHGMTGQFFNFFGGGGGEGSESSSGSA